jgi:hypothetical protein
MVGTSLLMLREEATGARVTHGGGRPPGGGHTSKTTRACQPIETLRIRN